MISGGFNDASSVLGLKDERLPPTSVAVKREEILASSPAPVVVKKESGEAPYAASAFVLAEPYASIFEMAKFRSTTPKSSLPGCSPLEAWLDFGRYIGKTCSLENSWWNK